ncbi:hypothetical protein BGZ94_007492 [Podila epigama]|nr:hypothetical protein BGZ94_007492 [Podila epigama]
MPRHCRFFLAGNCRFGARCQFYHEGFSDLRWSTFYSSEDEDISSPPPHNHYSDESEDEHEIRSSSVDSGSDVDSSSNSGPDSGSGQHSGQRFSKPCRWYLAGYCRRGDECWFSHDIASTSGPGGTSFRTNDASSSETLQDSSEDDDVDRKCAICFDVPTTFGLLASCNHAFCLTCIRTWRSKDIPSSHQDALEDRMSSVTKACPNCRTPSLYVVPSSFFPTNQEQKDQIFSAYKEAASKRPCRYFKRSGNRRWCPFANDCFFAHLDSNGEPCQVNENSNPRLRRHRAQMNGLRHNNPLFQDIAESFGGFDFNDVYGPSNIRLIYNINHFDPYENDFDEDDFDDEEEEDVSESEYVDLDDLFSDGEFEPWRHHHEDEDELDDDVDEDEDDDDDDDEADDDIENMRREAYRILQVTFGHTPTGFR